eukprot:2628635-Rhodomonas_salina.3
MRRLLAWLPFENPADPQLPPHVRIVMSYCSKSAATKAVLQPLSKKGVIAQLKGLKCELGDDGAGRSRFVLDRRALPGRDADDLCAEQSQC